MSKYVKNLVGRGQKLSPPQKCLSHWATEAGSLWYALLLAPQLLHSFLQVLQI